MKHLSERLSALLARRILRGDTDVGRHHDIVRLQRLLCTSARLERLHLYVGAGIDNVFLAFVVECHVSRGIAALARLAAVRCTGAAAANGYKAASVRLVGLFVARVHGAWEPGPEPDFQEREHHRKVGGDDGDEGFSGAPCSG